MRDPRRKTDSPAVRGFLLVCRFAWLQRWRQTAGFQRHGPLHKE